MSNRNDTPSGGEPRGPELGIDCERALELLPRYGDGELSESTSAVLRHHLMACPACRSVAAEQRSLARWFEPTEPVAVPVDFAARVAAAIQASPRADAGPAVASAAGFAADGTGSPAEDRGAALQSTREAGPVRDFVLFLTAAAAVALFALSIVIGLGGKPEEETLSASEVTEVLRMLEATREALELEAGAESRSGAQLGAAPGTPR